MTNFNNNNNNRLHPLGLHVFGSSWQVEFENRPYPTSALLFNYATVIYTHVNNNNSGKSMTSIALIGGSHERCTAMASVTILQDIFNVLSKKKWHKGPNINECREYMGASVCRGYAYVIGGADDNYVRGGADSDTIERIPLSELFRNHNDQNQNADAAAAVAWTTLSARLSGPRRGCTAVTVHDRFIVVIGGENCRGFLMSAVDIIDTMTQQTGTTAPTTMNNNHEGHHSVVTTLAGPSLQMARSFFGATFLNDEIWVVGGRDDYGDSNVVECLRYESLSTSTDSSQTIFSSPWKMRPKRALRHQHDLHCIVAIGQCLVVVAGGKYNRNKDVDLLDPKHGVVLELPNMVDRRVTLDMIQMLDNGLFVLCLDTSYGGLSMQSLPWMNLSLTQLKKYSKELELRQRSYISGLISPLNESQEEEEERDPSQILLRYRRAQVKSLCDSLVYFYLFDKGGHVSYLQKQLQQQQKKQSLLGSNIFSKRCLKKLKLLEAPGSDL